MALTLDRRPAISAPPTVPTGICWTTVAGLALIHAGGVAGIVWLVFNPSLATVILALVFYVVCGLAITAGYHRLFAHRTYRSSPVVRWFLLAFGAATFQNSAVSWSADHRAHHADTDGPTDPHAITKGAAFAHIGWLFRRRSSSADVTQLSDLWALRSIRIQHRFYVLFAVGFGLLLPTLIAAQWGDPWGGLLVAGFLRAAFTLQATFSINSLAHMIGTRPYDTQSSARDSGITALVSFGEGYHNFHHRFPFDYRNGSRWWQYDPGKWLIWTLAHLRMVGKVRTASPATIARAISTTGARA